MSANERRSRADAVTRPTVLVTDGDLRSGLAAVRSIGKHDSHVISGSSSHLATSFFSKYVDERVVYPSPETRPKEFVSFIADILRERGDIDVVLPIGQESTVLLAEHRKRFPVEVAFSTPPWDVFRTAMDKAETLKAAREAGVPVPRTVFPDNLHSVERLCESLDAPIVVKPRISSGSRGLRYVDDMSDLPAVYREVNEAYPNPLIQERLPPDGEGLGAAFLFDESGECRAEFAYRRLREYPPSGGPSTLRESIEGRDIRTWGRQLLETLDWSGVAMVEFKQDSRDGQPKLMEVNPRFWGSLHLPVHAGVDFPWLAVQNALRNVDAIRSDYEIGVRCRHLLPGDILNLLARRNLAALREFVPLRDDNLYYDILDSDDVWPTFGRIISLGSQVVQPRVWRRSILRR